MENLNNQNTGISVVIPSYNQRQRLLKALDSVSSQSYRPIQVIIADDASPTVILTKSEIDFYRENRDLDLIYYRNEENLGFYKNFRDALKFVKFKYYVLLPHDDYYTDSNFFSRAIGTLEQGNSNVNCFVANSVDEETGSLMMTHLNFESELLSSHQFVSGIWNKYHSNHSAIILNFQKLKALGYQDLLLTNSELDRFNKSADEAFICLFLISCDSNFFLESKSVVVRGHNETSWSRSDYWASNMSYCLFLSYYNFLSKCSILPSRTKLNICLGQLKRFPINKINWEFFINIREVKYKFLFLLNFLFGFSLKLRSKMEFELKRFLG